jgi:hypothetical protein
VTKIGEAKVPTGCSATAPEALGAVKAANTHPTISPIQTLAFTPPA